VSQIIPQTTLSGMSMLILVGVLSVSTTYTFGFGSLIASCLAFSIAIFWGSSIDEMGFVFAGILYILTLTLTILLPYYNASARTIRTNLFKISSDTAAFICLTCIAALLSSAVFLTGLQVYKPSIDLTLYDYAQLSTFSALGVIGITPALSSWKAEHKWPQLPNDPREYSIWTLSLFVISLLAIGLQREYLLLVGALVVWSTIRFNWFGACLAICVATIFIAPQLQTAQPLSVEAAAITGALVEPLTWLTLVATLLYFASLLADRRRVEKHLEQRVAERTFMLDSMNKELSDEVRTRKNAELNLQKLNKRYRTLIETAGIPVIVLNNRYKIEHWNSASEAASGYRYIKVLGRDFMEFFIPKESRGELDWRLKKASASGVNQENVECELITAGDNRLTMLWNISYIDDEELEEHGQYLLIGQDITKIRQTQNQLHYLAHFDSLTGAANRRLFEDRCKQAIESAKRYGGQLALISLDIDHFKKINDTLGHDAGDDFLSTLVKRITTCIRKEDTVARLGGDEFSILLNNVNGQEGAERAARNLMSKITEPFKVQGSELVITSSIGITICPDDNTDFGGLVKNADMAMYRAKSAGRNNIQFYNKEMNVEMQRQIQIESELHIALAEDEFELHYQPIVDTKSGEIVALEALLRWSHPENGLRYPAEFLGVADQTGLLQDIGKWSINQICKEGAQIMRNRDTEIPIAFNLTKRQYDHPSLLPTLEQACDQHDFNPRNIIIELSENTINQNTSDTLATLQGIKALGAMITIDGFGKGISSLSQLNQLPIDIIKIDRSFISRCINKKQDRIIIETLLAISKQLGLKTFATGVETRQQEAFLQKHGCRYAQGFLYSEALPLAELLELTGANTPDLGEQELGQITLPFEQDAPD
jgi:diguanylate cyclase (GGDEF)-like protein/PAS domain S-box-containing protein